ncbi:ADP-forming succinate--CoA ligase subunit beta [Marinoscillum furvescens]|uniref:Succinate--CoA ligase [ADP-forming] subunit beta n=1 Tax=Marinoscillum furvescens DSM 4134 TaxID=1122208 RepID=A0A3D9L4W4_MARFU|nr:ADP-forming succinate--CoA ligase subunit beta [Marinoscillum furvescens]REE01065.1 succinyl-CoA synthetase beta subunit [Marinoscillum furvescens DSM 4134]
MNIHEYQAKDILKSYGVTIQEGIVADTPEKAVEAAKELNRETGTEWYVVKAQIHAGGRGKGKVQETGSNGVVLAKSLDEVKPKSEAILGGTLVTHQTGAEGKKVNKVLIAQDVYYPGESEPKEYYLSILLDRAKGCNVIMASTEGGMDIETVAEETPEKIVKEWIDPAVGLQGFQARKVAFALGLEGQAFKEMVKFIFSLYKAYEATDSSQFEINPVLKTSDNKILAVDAKVNLDDNALYRHKDIAEMRDLSEEDPLEVEAGQNGLNYVKLDGNVGCMVNGAGLAMATMDIIKLSGGEPANFLDVGGGANAQTVEAGFRIILKDPNVKAILINIFGGIVRCDRVANGVVEAYKSIGDIDVPIIVRLQGTNAEEGAKIIDESGLKVVSAVVLKDAAEKVKEVLA